MLLKTPTILSHSNVKCDVKGWKLTVGDKVSKGDYLAELRYEVIDNDYSDCPIVHYGDLVACADGLVMSVSEETSGMMGMVIAEIGNDIGDFPVKFETI